MRLSAPKENTWWVAMIFGVLGILGYYGVIPALSSAAFVLVVIGFLLLVFGTYLKGF